MGLDHGCRSPRLRQEDDRKACPLLVYLGLLREVDHVGPERISRYHLAPGGFDECPGAAVSVGRVADQDVVGKGGGIGVGAQGEHGYPAAAPGRVAAGE
jgi:hypothetical protein